MDAIYISKIIINECLDKNIGLSITKLHKLLYIIYGVYLVIENKRLFEELPCCFRYGPLFKSVQKEYKNNDLRLTGRYDINANTDEALNIIVSKVISSFGKSSGTVLSKWSHRDSSAWSEAYKDNKYWGNDIKEEYIKKEFNAILG